MFSLLSFLYSSIKTVLLIHRKGPRGRKEGGGGGEIGGLNNRILWVTGWPLASCCPVKLTASHMTSPYVLTHILWKRYMPRPVFSMSFLSVT